MNPIVRIALIPLLVASIVLNIAYYFRLHPKQTATSVHDGDTFTLSNGDRVKLLGFDAPEIGNCLSQESKNRLSQLITGKSIRIQEEKRDAYGRRMGLVYAGQILVNEVLLREGFGRATYEKNSQSEKLKNAYAEAVQHKYGIHSPTCKTVNPSAPNDTCVIKGNIDKATGDHFYHLPTCRHYSQIVLDADLGEGFFCTEQEARDKGFRIAPDCLR